MALVTFNYIRSCFGWSRRSDDTERIVDDRVPAVDGSDMPDGVVTATPTISARMTELEGIVKKLVERNEHLENKNERLEEMNNRLEERVDRLEAEVADQGVRLDRQQSHIESLRQGMEYEQQQHWRRHNVTYSPTYRSEEEEAPPPEFSS